MVDAAKFIKSHLKLCIATCGFAVLGYLGYHAVKWIIAKCSKTEKIDQAASTVLKVDPSKARPVPSVADHHKVSIGHGEYLLFKKGGDGQNIPLTSEEYQRAYEVLNQWTPQAIVKREGAQAAELCARRDQIIRAKLKEIDQAVEAVFIPRTLYELILIRKCIKEDLKNDKICQGVDRHANRRELAKTKKKCWHLCGFDDLKRENCHPRLMETAYRLNQVMLKTFQPKDDAFSMAELRDFTQKEIQFLKGHYQSPRASKLANCNEPGPTTNFGCESTRGSIMPMGIRHEKDANIILNALFLECSEVARTSFFLYRGATFEHDMPFSSDAIRDRLKGYGVSKKEKKDETLYPYSLSYGSSLFAGGMFDGGATAFHFMRKLPQAYAVTIPFEKLASSPFYVPETNALVQFYSHGEIFHGRTKYWKGADVKRLHGGMLGGGTNIGHLASQLSQDELTAEFTRYKEEAIQLK